MDLNNETQQSDDSLPHKASSDERAGKRKSAARYIVALVISVLVLLVLSYFGSSKMQTETPPEACFQTIKTP